MTERRILIVGGGIAGLSLAAALRRADLPCEVVEQTPSWAPVGAGIALSVNAMRVLRSIGVEEAFAGRSHRLGEMAITDARGRVLGRSDLKTLEPRFGASLAVHRAVLHDVLLTAARDVPLRLGCTVTSLEARDEGVAVRFSDGREDEFALVVGADGVHSSVRELVFGRLPVVYAGYTCWRLVVSRPESLVRGQEMWGHGQRFGLVPVDAERVYCFAVANAREGEADPEEGRVERFRRRFASFGGPVPEVLARVERSEQLIHNDLGEIRLDAWSAGRVVLVGDAAHAMTPNMGQGAAMALEDGAVLAELLAERRPEPAGLPRLLADWEARRRSRVDWVQSQSRRIGRVAQWRSPLACSLRNALARLVPDAASTRALVRMAEQPV